MSDGETSKSEIFPCVVLAAKSAVRVSIVPEGCCTKAIAVTEEQP